MSISRFAQLMSRKDRIRRIRNKAFTFLDAVEQSKAICWSKFNLQSIVTPRSLTKFVGFKILLPILNSNWLESLIPKNMTWNFAGLEAIELKLNHSKVCVVFLWRISTTTDKILFLAERELSSAKLCKSASDMKKKQIVYKNVK